LHVAARHHFLTAKLDAPAARDVIETIGFLDAP